MYVNILQVCEHKQVCVVLSHGLTSVPQPVQVGLFSSFHSSVCLENLSSLFAFSSPRCQLVSLQAMTSGWGEVEPLWGEGTRLCPAPTSFLKRRLKSKSEQVP